MQNITSGFKNTGIYPLNTNIFIAHDFLPSEISNLPDILTTEMNTNLRPDTTSSIIDMSQVKDIFKKLLSDKEKSKEKK
ncbi:hypothetical protein ABEB36_014634 [Hypothenemus hampei]|uniref:Uncharacterized protein n=1 Tax=Hypothenemus hampei TaxID=57062 RepID=A0ABD1E539_HYPHA